MAEFKAGSFKLATKSKCPIIPITINGSYKIMEHGNGSWIKKGNCRLSIYIKWLKLMAYLKKN